eukprot:TRINITY_DN74894_c0_g1_i1.p1 TRINITY_DN74894_c0_g1~~TRINITY_DN74894_c0_g1_i1.p1  ORF type:complete len:339 (-),score=79.41 TRINITY_DN74894_c0_g1_i1:68-1084(-)
MQASGAVQMSKFAVFAAVQLAVCAYADVGVGSQLHKRGSHPHLMRRSADGPGALGSSSGALFHADGRSKPPHVLEAAAEDEAQPMMRESAAPQVEAANSSAFADVAAIVASARRHHRQSDAVDGVHGSLEEAIVEGQAVVAETRPLHVPSLQEEEAIVVSDTILGNRQAASDDLRAFARQQVAKQRHARSKGGPAADKVLPGYSTRDGALGCHNSGIANAEFKADWAEGCVEAQNLDYCVSKAKDTCDQHSDCWGFGVNEAFGVQLYREEAVDEKEAKCSKKGLQPNGEWTTFEKMPPDDGDLNVDPNATSDKGQASSLEALSRIVVWALIWTCVGWI